MVSFLVLFCSILKFCCSGKQSKNKNSPDYVPSVFSFSQNTEERRRNSVDRYERLIKPQKTITSAVDNCSADTGNEGDENVEEKAGQADSTIILVEDKSLQPETPTLPQEIHSKNLYNRVKKTINYLIFFVDLPNHSIFLRVYSLVSERELFVCSKVTSKEEHLPLVLMKLKQRFSNADFAFKFSILHFDVSRIYNSWIVELSNVLKSLMIWRKRDALRKTLANYF